MTKISLCYFNVVFLQHIICLIFLKFNVIYFWENILENIKANRDFLLSKIEQTHKNSFYCNFKVPKLVAVSKKQDNYKIDKAIECGQKFFGENRVQEASLRWQERIKTYKGLELRLIGPLQSNKVKQSLKLFDVIETIDREKIAVEIAKHFHEDSKTKRFYIQINTGNEPQKSGLDPLQADLFIKYCINDLNLPIVGLMCIPPQNEEQSVHFVLLKKIASRNNLHELSMGMSNDYQDAIKFGATSVRIGSLFFGKRQI